MIKSTTFDSDRRITLFGVPSRLTHRTRKPGQAAPLWFKQRIVTDHRPAGVGYPKGSTIQAELRFDDECGNGHNSFAITATVHNPRRQGGDCEACGSLHEDIAQVFPELAHLIKWHNCSTDGPLHYVANTVYHARDRDHTGKRAGEPTRFEERLYFGEFPISFGGKKPVREMLKDKAATGTPIFEFELEVTPIPHNDKNRLGAYQFADKYNFAGCVDNGWAYAPFDSIGEAEEWANAIKMGWRLDSVPVAFSEGKERDFDAARRAGVWPDATDEQLSAEPEELKAALLERLPALVDAMKADITAAGFYWSAEDYVSREAAE